MKNKNKILIPVGIIIFAICLISAAENFFIFPKKELNDNTPSIFKTLPSSLPVGEPTKQENNEFVNLPTNNVVTSPSANVMPSKSKDVITSYIIEVPFTSQAPFKVWDAVHNDACEEASLVMARHWSDGHLLNAAIADKEILDSINWEDQNWGQQYELNAEKIVELGQRFFNLNNLTISPNPTVDDIKNKLKEGNLILVPIAGRELNNPYYRSPGPIYHVLVIKGYDSAGFITNDPGTRNGESYHYSYQTLLNAIHDWPYPSPDFGINVDKNEQARAILSGSKVIIVVGR
ncbi:MAG: C39 family peptidase [Patescibacteria group bacterium]|nr:C39 family peptidase [Patescibacteria group bacterium]MDD5121150.1 C39 family peptidase [Patescibacteria group bacterium]MDD5221665.1 C39 family peptidase [Patescibacteria group bacterium]MDD5395931.1 C39 family peptidase [Patescibacteria group bacterium]